MTTLNYIGHSAFTIEYDGKTIAVDPFISGNPSATISPDDISPDYIFITHAHNDHVGDSVSLARRTGAPIITVVELADYLGTKDVETVGLNHGGTYRFEGGSAKFVPAWHSSSFTLEDGSVVAPGVPAGIVFTIGEGDARKKIYFAGDTSLFLDMQLIGDEELDVAVLPIGDHYTMGPADAIRAVKFLRPRFVIPCHCNTFPLLEQDKGEFSKNVEEQTSAGCRALEPGQSWEVE